MVEILFESEESVTQNDEIYRCSDTLKCGTKGKLVTFVAGKAKNEKEIKRFVFCGDNDEYASGTHKFGQDSYFINENDQFTFIGVADGVGGWLKRNVDSGKFSSALMRIAHQVTVQAMNKQETHFLSPRSLMTCAYCQLMEHEPEVYGSSTACFVVVDKINGYFSYCNLGDSGYILFKADGHIVRSKKQQHKHNNPYQLTNAPPGAGPYIYDTPRDAKSDECNIEIGDIVLMGSDGLWDNFDIVDTFLSSEFPKSMTKTFKQIQEFAIKLQQKVMNASMSSHKVKKLHSYTKSTHYGAKNDDVTIIVSAIVEESNDSICKVSYH